MDEDENIQVTEEFTEEPLALEPFLTYMQTHAGKMLTDSMNEMFLAGRLELEHITKISDAFDAAMHRAIRRQTPDDVKLLVEAHLKEYQDLADVAYWKAADAKLNLTNIGTLKASELITRATL